MTLIRLSDGKILMRNGSVAASAQFCKCSVCEKNGVQDCSITTQEKCEECKQPVCVVCYPPPYLCYPLQILCYKDGSPYAPREFVDCEDCYANGGDFCDTFAMAGLSYFVNDCSECEGGLVDIASNNARGDCYKGCGEIAATSCEECLSWNNGPAVAAPPHGDFPLAPWVFECGISDYSTVAPGGKCGQWQAPDCRPCCQRVSGPAIGHVDAEYLGKVLDPICTCDRPNSQGLLKNTVTVPEQFDLPVTVTVSGMVSGELIVDGQNLTRDLGIDNAFTPVAYYPGCTPGHRIGGDTLDPPVPVTLQIFKRSFEVSVLYQCPFPIGYDAEFCFSSPHANEFP